MEKLINLKHTILLHSRVVKANLRRSISGLVGLVGSSMPESGTKVLGFLRLRHKTRHKWCTSDTCVLEGRIPHLERMRQMSRTLVSHPHIDWVLSKLPQSHTHFSTLCWLQIAHDFVPQHQSPRCSSHTADYAMTRWEPASKVNLWRVSKEVKLQFVLEGIGTFCFGWDLKIPF